MSAAEKHAPEPLGACCDCRVAVPRSILRKQRGRCYDHYTDYMREVGEDELAAAQPKRPEYDPFLTCEDRAREYKRMMRDFDETLEFQQMEKDGIL